MSIYNEIQSEIQSRVSEGRLLRLLPWLPRVGDAPARQMYVSPSINELFQGPWESLDWEVRCSELRAQLDEFTDGAFPLAVAPHPLSRKQSYLKRLKPLRDEAWEIRSWQEPPLRLFGRFALKNVFIALIWARRDELGDLTTLEGVAAWKAAIADCGHQWRALFPAHKPITGDLSRDYVSNCFLV